MNQGYISNQMHWVCMIHNRQCIIMYLNYTKIKENITRNTCLFPSNSLLFFQMIREFEERKR